MTDFKNINELDLLLLARARVIDRETAVDMQIRGYEIQRLEVPQRIRDMEKWLNAVDDELTERIIELKTAAKESGNLDGYMVWHPNVK